MDMDAKLEESMLGFGEGSPRAAAAYERRYDEEREEGRLKAPNELAKDDGSIVMEVDRTCGESSLLSV